MHSPWAALLVLALCLSPGPGRPGPDSSGPGAGQTGGADRVGLAAAPAADRPSPVPSPSQTEELNRRIHGMEGKLRDSAAARKSADQARMEAERRLAAGTQKSERLGAEVRALREAKLALEGRLKRLEQEGARVAGALVAAQESQRQLAALRDAERRRGEACGRQVATLQAELASVSQDRGAARSERGAAGARPGAAPAPPRVGEGAAPGLSEAQVRAAAAAADLRAARLRTGADRPAVREAEQAMHLNQVAVARASGARTVYRVQQSDTLAIVAGRFYRDGSRWRAIYAANRHVLDDPGRLIAGMTLVIP